MEKQRNSPDMIDLMVCPGFCVQDNKIIQVNDGAKRLFLSPGMEITSLLLTGQAEFADLKQGCLYLKINAAGAARGAVVTAIEDFYVFLIDDEQELRQLQILALAAQELRIPLSNIMVCADRISSQSLDPQSQEYADRLHRGTAQMHRLIGNMSDALRYTQGWSAETRNVTALMQEIMDHAQELARQAGITLHYQGISEDVYTLVDTEQLERAVYNLLSNALKFTPQGGSIAVCLKKSGKHLYLSILDSGSGIAQGVRQNIFSRFLRTPSLEDGRYGLGLGLVLVRCAAANHGGTVLIDQPAAQGTRVTLTLAIQKSPEAILRSPRLRVDYAGGTDHGLLELSESLPFGLYHKESYRDPKCTAYAVQLFYYFR